MQPPMGGWAVNVELQGERRVIAGHTPAAVFDNLMKFARSLNFPMVDIEAQRILNDDWVRRDPGRAHHAYVASAMTPFVHKPPEAKHSHIMAGKPYYHGPSRWGPAAWLWLNAFGMRGAWNKDDWDATIDRITFLLNSARSPGTGCPECFKEWLSLCKKNDPKKIDQQALAMRFVFNSHNEVNRKLGKQQLTWKDAIYMHGWYIAP